MYASTWRLIDANRDLALPGLDASLPPLEALAVVFVGVENDATNPTVHDGLLTLDGSLGHIAQPDHGRYF